MINISKPIIGKKEINAVISVLRSGIVVQGPRTAKLEKRFAEYCGTKYAVALSSGTAAMHAGLYALGITEEDEVITTPFTFVATANSILMQGAKVVFADISEEDFNLDPKEVEKKITKATKAILPVDLYGQIYNYKAIKQIADKNNLKILEDACQAVGAEQNSIKAGNFGDVSAFSLYATKNIMCGEGGMITTNDEKTMEKCKQFRHHGQSEKTKYEYFDLGYNYRMTDISASIALEQLKKVDIFNRKRIKNAEILNDGLRGLKGIIIPNIKKENCHVFHQYTLRITEEFKKSRDELKEFLKNNGIECAIYYPKPLHLQPHFVKIGYKEGDFPVAEKISKQVISLPAHPSLTQDDVNYIINKIRFYAK